MDEVKRVHAYTSEKPLTTTEDTKSPWSGPQIRYVCYRVATVGKLNYGVNWKTNLSPAKNMG
jgi:hypothetical protein